MNKDQQRNLLRTADAIGDHLAWAWNYVATLRALQKHARSRPKLIEKHNHFFSTVMFAMWDALFLKLSHCSDKNRNATGFPRLFKELRAYLPQEPKVRAAVSKQEQVLLRLTARRKIENWRDEAVAHRTFAADCRQFFEDNKCTLDEVEKLVSRYQRILHSFTFPLFDLGFRVRDHGPRAHRGVNRLMASMKEGRTSASSVRSARGGPRTTKA